MSLSLSKPIYKAKPIRSLASLAKALGLDEKRLKELALKADTLWRAVKAEPGSTRQTFDAYEPLKRVHERIKRSIFSKVSFPAYLHGSLKGCDYVTNAALHKGQQILICEDVKSFFPSVQSVYVRDVWAGLFGFSSEVTDILTALTTKDGALPQGGITSSYLANLVLWRKEPLLQAKLAARGITYSRYVDDMSMSSKTLLDKETQSWVIAQVYGMLAFHGLKASRKKHDVFSASKPMIATKLIVNQKPALPKAKRSNIRAQVKQLELASQSSIPLEELKILANKASQRVGLLGRFHETEANALRLRIKAVRASFTSTEEVRVTGAKLEDGHESSTIS